MTYSVNPNSSIIYLKHYHMVYAHILTVMARNEETHSDRN
jgi:hypothetical protein